MSRPVRQRRPARRNGRRLDDRCGCLAEGEEAVEYHVKILQRIEMDLEDESILSGNAVAFGNFRHRLRQRYDLGQLAGHGPDADKGRDRKPKGL